MKEITIDLSKELGENLTVIPESVKLKVTNDKIVIQYDSCEKLKSMNINGVELEEGKLYKLANNPKEWDDPETWIFRFDYIQCGTDRLIMSKSCLSLDDELKNIDFYEFQPSALCSLTELIGGNYQAFPCNEGEIKAFEYFENYAKKNNLMSGHYLENQVLEWKTLVDEFLKNQQYEK